MAVIDLSKTPKGELTDEVLKDACERAGAGGAVVVPAGTLKSLRWDAAMSSHLDDERTTRREEAIFSFVEQTLRLSVHLTGGQALLSAPLADEQIRRMVRAARVAYDEIDNPTETPADPGASTGTEEEGDEA